jgi:hypothetical protein
VWRVMGQCDVALARCKLCFMFRFGWTGCLGVEVVGSGVSRGVLMVVVRCASTCAARLSAKVRKSALEQILNSSHHQ